MKICGEGWHYVTPHAIERILPTDVFIAPIHINQALLRDTKSAILIGSSHLLFGCIYVFKSTSFQTLYPFPKTFFYQKSSDLILEMVIPHEKGPCHLLLVIKTFGCRWN